MQQDKIYLNGWKTYFTNMILSGEAKNTYNLHGIQNEM